VPRIRPAGRLRPGDGSAAGPPNACSNVMCSLMDYGPWTINDGTALQERKQGHDCERQTRLCCPRGAGSAARPLSAYSVQCEALK